jgi:hypothetical protein
MLKRKMQMIRLGPCRQGGGSAIIMHLLRRAEGCDPPGGALMPPILFTNVSIFAGVRQAV